MLQERIEPAWIDAFEAVLRRCALQPGDTVAILGESQSRPVLVEPLVIGARMLGLAAGLARESRHPLSRAVVAPRLDAEAMAKAAGYQIGALLEISSGAPSEGPILMSMDMMRGAKLAAAAEPTPVNPGELKVVETVTVRWAVKQ